MFKVENLVKDYGSFKLDGVSFNIRRGYITGIVGANGAGKSTTLKCMLGITKPDGGTISAFGTTLADGEQIIKQKVAFSEGGVDYYGYEKCSRLAKYYKTFYPDWSDEKFDYYIKRFEIDLNKKIRNLSAGMKVKFSLALSLARDSELFVFDEPTSGLDPVSRDEIIDEFRRIIESGEKSIVYSTHITSDLDKCADFLILIDGGKILLDGEVESVLSSHYLVGGGDDEWEKVKDFAIGAKKNKYGFNALIKAENLVEGLEYSRPTLEDITIFYNRKNRGVK